MSDGWIGTFSMLTKADVSIVKYNCKLYGFLDDDRVDRWQTDSRDYVFDCIHMDSAKSKFPLLVTTRRIISYKVSPRDEQTILSDWWLKFSNKAAALQEIDFLSLQFQYERELRILTSVLIV